MGNCCGKAPQQSGPQQWRATGIVSLRDRGLTKLPKEVLSVGLQARALDASNNRLSALPDCISQLSNITRLTLTSNCLTSIPSSIEYLKGLKLLALDYNQLTSLPVSVGQLSALDKLTISNNRLVELPSTLGDLYNLSVLDVSHNSLSSLPVALSGCTHLTDLNAADNQLTSVPAELSLLVKLKVLQLDRNRISSLPNGFLRSCVVLHTISLHGNPITADMLAQVDGYQEFEVRRRDKFSKQIATGALMNSNRLDDGIDR
eukprot:jgi/Chlat1/2456/Chrsp171S02338